MKRLPSIITDKIELEIGECNCGYHFGVDATFIDQVGDVTFNCPSCNQPIDTAKLFPEDGGETSETTDPKRTVTVHHNGRDHTFPNFDHVEISQEIDIPGEDGPPTGPITLRVPRPNLSTCAKNFFAVEIRNEDHGGIRPATLASAKSSLDQGQRMSLPNGPVSISIRAMMTAANPIPLS